MGRKPVLTYASIVCGGMLASVFGEPNWTGLDFGNFRYLPFCLRFSNRQLSFRQRSWHLRPYSVVDRCSLSLSFEFSSVSLLFTFNRMTLELWGTCRFECFCTLCWRLSCFKDKEKCALLMTKDLRTDRLFLQDTQAQKCLSISVKWRSFLRGVSCGCT